MRAKRHALFLETLLRCCYFASFGYTNANAGANRTATSSWVRSFCHRECGGRSTHFARISRKQGRPPHLHEVCGSVEGDSYEREKGAMQGFALGLEGSERQSDRRPRKTFFLLFISFRFGSSTPQLYDFASLGAYHTGTYFL